MQILIIRKAFLEFECKFEPFERDLKHPNPNLKHLNQILIIQMQIRTLQARFEALECKL